MRIDVVGRNIEITPAIREYATTKLEKLVKFFDGIQQITLTVSKEHAHQTGEFKAEVVLDVEKHNDFIAQAIGADLYATIDLASEKGARQLKDFKERLKG